MVKYYTRPGSNHHLYKCDDETGEFYWMDHCWTGKGCWVLRDCPVPNIIEISEEEAMELCCGTLYTANHVK